MFDTLQRQPAPALPPPTFVDNKGRRWVVHVEIDALRRIRAVLGVDLLDHVFGGPMLQRLANHPELLVDLLYVLCSEDAEARGVSDEDFGRSLAGGVIAHATDALLIALANFCPPVKRRLVLSAYRAAGGSQ